jgi:hypothetical protein
MLRWFFVFGNGMKKLTDIILPPILDTSSGDIIKDFFNPALGASVLKRQVEIVL